MPLAQNTDQAQSSALEAELERLREKGADTRALEAELEKLRKQMRLADKFPPTRVLEIDAKTGRLFYLDPGRVEISDRARPGSWWKATAKNSVSARRNCII